MGLWLLARQLYVQAAATEQQVEKLTGHCFSPSFLSSASIKRNHNTIFQFRGMWFDFWGHFLYFSNCFALAHSSTKFMATMRSECSLRDYARAASKWRNEWNRIVTIRYAVAAFFFIDKLCLINMETAAECRRFLHRIFVGNLPPSLRSPACPTGDCRTY